MSDRTAVIIGAGPAGLTAAYELLTRAGIRPVVLERSNYLGGISRTIAFFPSLRVRKATQGGSSQSPVIGSGLGISAVA